MTEGTCSIALNRLTFQIPQHRHDVSAGSVSPDENGNSGIIQCSSDADTDAEQSFPGVGVGVGLATTTKVAKRATSGLDDEDELSVETLLQQASRAWSRPSSV
ncbi:hypothetical protein PG984_014504 [Apiospora sp. TS-2023a]